LDLVPGGVWDVPEGAPSRKDIIMRFGTGLHSTLRARAALAILAALAASLFAIAAPANAASPPSATARPTIVLVHGAFADPSGWSQVEAQLQSDGYATVAPALGLSSLADDAAIVRATLDGIAGPKIVVAHSYGGMVASNATTGRTDVQALVFTSAYLPVAGDSISSLGNGYAPPAFLAGGFPGDLLIGPSGAIIDPAHFQADFAQDLNPKLAATLAAHQHPANLGILFDQSGTPGWATIPSWYAVSGADRIIDPALQRWMAARAGATTVSFDEASHAGGYTHYSNRFVKLIEQAAVATAQ
jgi:pimeloyl-ACP methyl ester carboxylesterase